MAVMLSVSAISLTGSTDACAESEKHRVAVAKKLALLVEAVEPTPMCMEMCKKTGACPVRRSGQGWAVRKRVAARALAEVPATECTLPIKSCSLIPSQK